MLWPWVRNGMGVHGHSRGGRALSVGLGVGVGASVRAYTSHAVDDAFAAM